LRREREQGSSFGQENGGAAMHCHSNGRNAADLLRTRRLGDAWMRQASWVASLWKTAVGSDGIFPIAAATIRP
jgi:hypothetical protein